MGSSLEESFQDQGLYEQGENDLEEDQGENDLEEGGVMNDDDFNKGGESSKEEKEIPVNVYNKNKRVKSKKPSKMNERIMRSRGDNTSGVTDKGKRNKKHITKKQKLTPV